MANNLNVGVNVHLEDETPIKVSSQLTCEVLRIGESLNGADIYMSTLAQARALETVIAQAIQNFLSKVSAADTVALQSERIAELEAQLKQRDAEA